MILSLLCAALSVSHVRSHVKIDRVDYHGWAKCFRMSNGAVELVYVPQIGRVMRFARISGPNILWENSKLFGKTANSAKPGEWTNYGGDKLWPAPQSNWNWPPDPLLDGAPYTVEVDGKSLIISGQASPKSGVRFTRRITMDPGGQPIVHISNTMTNTSKKPQELALWEIAQTDDPDKVIVPLQVTKEMPNGWAPYDSKPIAPEFASIQNRNELFVYRNPKAGFKLGSASAVGTLEYIGHIEQFLMKAHKAPGKYVDGGKFLAVYASGDPLKYVELEITGPLTTLKPGQACNLEVTWQGRRILP